MHVQKRPKTGAEARQVHLLPAGKQREQPNVTLTLKIERRFNFEN